MFKKCSVKLFAIMIVSIYGGLCLTTANASYPVLMLDFSNSTTPTQLEPGFNAFTIADSGSTIKSITITLEPIEPDPPIEGNPAVLDARWRWAPPDTVPYWLVYRDFIFSRPGGIRVTLSGLLPNEAYEVTIWTFDIGSAGDHYADWYANGEFCLTAYLNGSDSPEDEYSNAYTGTADSNATGQIVLEAYPNPSHPDPEGDVTPYGFINALLIAQVNPIVAATNPTPEDGATVPATNVDLSWTPGMFADKHDVYFGTDFDDVNNANKSNPLGVLVSEEQEPNSYSLSDLDPETTYYWRIDEVNDPDVWKSKVWSFYVPPKTAYNPSPVDGALFADPNFTEPEVVLSWHQAADANSYDVYFGDVFNDVNQGIGGTYKGTVTDPSYDLNMMLQFNKTYYWRVDVFDGITTYTGAVWSFTTSPAELGTINMDIWENITGGSTLNLLTDDPRYPDSPTRTEKLTSFDSGEEVGTDYGGRIHGWVYVPLTGDYTFYFTSAGQGQLWLSTDEDPNNLMPEPLAAELTWGSYNSFTHISDPIPLIGGNKYYIMAIWKDFASWDHCQVAWKGAGIPDQQIIQGCYLSPFEYDRSFDPYPQNGAIGVEVDVNSHWTPGVYADKHDIYIGTDFITVNDANRTNPMGVLVEQDYDANTYEPNNLQFITTYYWRIDDVNDPNIYKGAVWSFTTRDISLIDDFYFYTGTGKSKPPPEDTLKSIWVDGNYAYELGPPQVPGTSGSLVQLNTDTYDGVFPEEYKHYQPGNFAQSGAQSMKFYYDNDGYVSWEFDLYGVSPPDLSSYIPDPDTYLSEAYAAIDDAAQTDPELDSLDLLRDFSGYKVLSLSYYGDPNNDAEPMYVGLEDGNGILVTISNDNIDLTVQQWQTWYIKLSDFTDKDASLDFNDIAKIYLGLGDKDSPSAGGSGVVFFDDIQFFEGICIPGSVPGDFDNDCIVNNSDLEIFTYGLPGEMPTMPTPIINLSAGSLSPGHISSWSNTGSLGGTFVDVNAADGNEPLVETVGGKKCVTFDNLDMLVWDQNAPATITSDTNEPNDFTVIYEVYNPAISDEEILFSWAQRGGPAATTASVGYGSNAAWAAVVHWNAGDLEPDMGFDRGVPAANQWHVIGVTYDGTTEALAVDGAIHNLEDKDLAIYADQPATIGAAFEPASPDAAYIRGTFVPTYDLRYIASVASVKVYAEAIPPGDLAILTASLAGLPKTETDVKPDSRIDFGDLAVMGNNWMQDPYLFGGDY